MPKVSICIPSYNQVVYLKNTLDSILAQTYTDYEVIITDDTPGTDVKDFVDQYNFEGKLKYYHNKTALGSPANWNFCISKASGEYIKILHHDDWFSNSDSLADFVNALEKEGAAIAFSNADVLYEKSNKKGFHAPGSQNISALELNPSILFLGNFIGAPSMTMYKRDEQLIFDENLKWLVDVDFYIRYLAAQKQFVYIPKTLITILAEGETTVTSGCLNNKSVEVFENCYLFSKLAPALDKGELISYSNFLLTIFNRFNISSLSKLQEVGYRGTLPLYFKMIFYLSRIRAVAISKIKKAKNSALSLFNTKHATK